MTKMIEIKNLMKKYGKNIVLKDITENVNKGQVICVIGPSGSGKSTFLRCLNVLEKPNSGKILFEGKDLTNISEKELYDRIKTGRVKRPIKDGRKNYWLNSYVLTCILNEENSILTSK